MKRSGLLIGLAVLVPACGQGSTEGFHMTAQPSHAQMFGQVDVTLTGDFSHLGAIQSVTVAGIAALRVTPVTGGLSIHVQGAPKPGPAQVIVQGASASASNDSAFSYDPPVGNAAPVWAAFGASLTQGFQSGGLDEHGQVMSYDAQAARAAGAYLAPPLVVEGVLPPLEPSAFVNNCNASFDVRVISQAILGTITDPATQNIDLRRARQDSTLPTRNFGVGGAMVLDIIAPAAGQPRLIERITELPDGDPTRFATPVSLSQMQRLVALDPDIALSADLLANDSDPATTASDDLHPELFTDVGTIQQELGTLCSTLGGLHGDYFIANLIDLTALPNVADLRAQRIAAGLDTAQSFDAKVATIQGLIGQYNAALQTAMAPYPNLHMVDLKAATDFVVHQGIVVGSQTLTNHKFGGLLSLDHVHFTDTGYALAANVFIQAINGQKGWHIPQVDLEAVNNADPLSPQALHADGVFCDTP